ncbi:hypothetical protein ACLQ26_27640 [Micromonospora sp. DT43]|uniref:hypothetical protein n=1 Tax=Micromonospora sp. DT43 TaxID=3393440 RepID=UPI003CEC00B8
MKGGFKALAASPASIYFCGATMPPGDYEVDLALLRWNDLRVGSRPPRAAGGPVHVPDGHGRDFYDYLWRELPVLIERWRKGERDH